MSGGEFVKSEAADAANFIFNWINARSRREKNKVAKRQGETLMMFIGLFLSAQIFEILAKKNSNNDVTNEERH